MPEIMETKSETYTCRYCNKSYKREKTLASHVCEKKRRHLSKNNKDVQIGLKTYLKFYKFTQNSKKQKTFDDFVNSPYYTAFVKFGNYCINTNVISIPRYTDYLIKGSKPLDNWCTDKMYSEFLEEFILIEPVEDALRRSIEYCIEWGDEKEMQYNDLFRYGSANRIIESIRAGKISPWMLYQSESGTQFIDKLDTRFVEYIWNMVHPDRWLTKFNKCKDDVDFAKSTLKLGGF